MLKIRKRFFKKAFSGTTYKSIRNTDEKKLITYKTLKSTQDKKEDRITRTKSVRIKENKNYENSHIENHPLFPKKINIESPNIVKTVKSASKKLQAKSLKEIKDKFNKSEKNGFKRVKKRKKTSRIKGYYIEEDILYQNPLDWDSSFSRLDLFFNQSTKQKYPKPVIIYIHEGGWIAGDKSNIRKINDAVIPLFFVNNGCIFIAVNFRMKFCPGCPNTDISEMLSDIVRAMEWISLNIRDYGGAPNNLILLGYSSGGHLASLLATDSRYIQESIVSESDIKGVISIDNFHYDIPNLIYNLSEYHNRTNRNIQRIQNIETIFGKDRDSQRYYSPSNFTNISSAACPFFLISSGVYGKEPESLGYLMTRNFMEMLVNESKIVKHKHYPDVDHFDLLTQFFSSGISESIVKFFSENQILPE